MDTLICVITLSWICDADLPKAKKGIETSPLALTDEADCVGVTGNACTRSYAWLEPGAQVWRSEAQLLCFG